MWGLLKSTWWAIYLWLERSRGTNLTTSKSRSSMSNWVISSQCVIYQTALDMPQKLYKQFIHQPNTICTKVTNLLSLVLGYRKYSFFFFCWTIFLSIFFNEVVQFLKTQRGKKSLKFKQQKSFVNRIKRIMIQIKLQKFQKVISYLPENKSLPQRAGPQTWPDLLIFALTGVLS